MKIIDLRRGFATNSSSTHSIIIADTGSGIDPSGHEYGWDKFLCESKVQKLSYMAQTLFGQLYRIYGEDIARHVCNSLFRNCLFSTNGYVDHQSEITCPVKAGTDKQLDIEFFRRLAEAIASDEAINIQGGNDNGGYDVGDIDIRWNWICKDNGRDSEVIVRKETEDIWTYFNRIDGTKIHIDFSSPGIVSKSFSPEWPELIDVKITNQCLSNCSFCYQDSTALGKHAKLDDIEHFAFCCGEKGVFEVALGGGEPTLHPQFKEILKAFGTRGIIVNFSTRSVDWFKDEELVGLLKKYCGAIGYSIKNVKEVKKFKELHALAFRNIDYSYRYRCKPVFHYIPDLYKKENLVSILRETADNTLLLLGYKKLGRAKLMSNKFPDIMKLIKKSTHGEIAIDTKFAQDYAGQLKSIPNILYQSEEGVNSFYIDLVDLRCGKSSYGSLSNFEKIWSCLDNWKNL